MSTPAADRLTAVATSASDHPDAPGVKGILLDGVALDAQVAAAVNDAETEESMDGASTFTLTLLDPEDELLTSALLGKRVDVEVDDLDYRLVAVASRPPLLVCTFEDRGVAVLRTYDKPRKAARGKVTRGEFAYSLVREARGERIGFHAPEMHRPQRISASETPSERAKRLARREDGFGRGADVEVKGVAANRSQLRVLDDVLEEGMTRKANRRCLIGAVACVTVESTARNLSGGDRDSRGAFQQQKYIGGKRTDWPASRNVKTDARAFYKRLIPLERKFGHSRTIGWLVDQVQRSQTFGTARQGSAYQSYEAEAERTVEAWLGGGGLATDARRRRKKYEFSRGQLGQREDSWTALGRLADEVKWRRFMRRGVVWFVREEYLIARPARMVLRRASDGVQRIEFEWDAGKKASGATVTMLASRWAALPGDRIDLAGLGPAGSGAYLVASVKRRRFSPLCTVTLKRPTPSLPEPAAELVSVKAKSRSRSRGQSDGRLDWPVTPHPITSGFGPRASPGGIGSTQHDGIDLGVSYVRVHAAGAGRVTRAGLNGGYGNYVEIDHGHGLVSFYGHLSAISVKAGRHVDKGDPIGTSGNTGNSTGPHLHFGVHLRGAARDPRDFL